MSDPLDLGYLMFRRTELGSSSMPLSVKHRAPSTLFLEMRLTHWTWSRLAGQEAPGIPLPPASVPLFLLARVIKTRFYIDARALNSGMNICTAGISPAPESLSNLPILFYFHSQFFITLDSHSSLIETSCERCFCVHSSFFPYWSLTATWLNIDLITFI